MASIPFFGRVGISTLLFVISLVLLLGSGCDPGLGTILGRARTSILCVIAYQISDQNKGEGKDILQDRLKA